MTWQLIAADCIDAMQAMDEASVDAVVCDPPYGLEFMGKEWDRLGDVRQPNDPTFHKSGSGPHDRATVRYGYDVDVTAMQGWHHAWAAEALRVLKPGGHLLAFGGTRTYHRLACAIEDAGFEIRDCLAWMYGSGFPKSLDVSKAIDKAQGVDTTADERWVPTPHPITGAMKTTKQHSDKIGQATPGERHLYAPSGEDAERWQGWGTALKPAFEPIVFARKPLGGTVAANVLEHGTGALNIDGTRIETEELVENHGRKPTENGWDPRLSGGQEQGQTPGQAIGRWPANVVLDEEAAAMLDEQSGETSYNPAGEFGTTKRTDLGHGIYGNGKGLAQEGLPVRASGDRGGASRFFHVVADEDEPCRVHGVRRCTICSRVRFRYTPKADSAERNRGLLPGERSTHPTVKPVALMQWLCRLVTPPGGTVLDPFTGSGSTGIAALREGFSFIGVEREAEYVEIARDRIIGDAPLLNTPAEVVA